MKTIVDRLIEESLSKARLVIEEGGTWKPLVHIVHPLGVRSTRVPGLCSGPVKKVKVVDEINHQLSVLNSNLMITVSDLWIDEDTPDRFVAISWDTPFTGHRKALIVAISACCDRLTCGMQMYMRCADGQVLFDEFFWGEHPV